MQNGSFSLLIRAKLYQITAHPFSTFPVLKQSVASDRRNKHALRNFALADATRAFKLKRFWSKYCIFQKSTDRVWSKLISSLKKSFLVIEELVKRCMTSFSSFMQVKAVYMWLTKLLNIFSLQFWHYKRLYSKSSTVPFFLPHSWKCRGTSLLKQICDSKHIQTSSHSLVSKYSKQPAEGVTSLDDADASDQGTSLNPLLSCI